MSVSDDPKKGRSSFPLHGDDKDYSGLDIRSAYLIDSDALSHSFMNGTDIVDGAFVGAALDQCELAEAQIEGSFFDRCDLSGSDLVRTKIVNSKFQNCNFENGEWRETEFEQVEFIGCDFTHATINLCKFAGCTFSSGSVNSLNHRSINYNVFIASDFDERVSSEHVLSQNFGLPAVGSKLPVARTGVLSLGEVCRLSETPLFRVRDLVLAIEAEAGRQTARANRLGLQFMANIVVALASARRISPSSMLYVEQIFARLAQTTTSNPDLQAAISAVVSIRNAMYELVGELRAELHPYEGNARRISASFEDDLPEEVGEELAEVLGHLFFERSGAATLTSIRHGSTIMEILLAASVPITTIVATLGMIFTQADIIVSKSSHIRDGVKKLFGRGTSESTALAPIAADPGKVPAIMRSGAVQPELAPIRIAVDSSGKTLILLDNRVEITILP